MKCANVEYINSLSRACARSSKRKYSIRRILRNMYNINRGRLLLKYGDLVCCNDRNLLNSARKLYFFSKIFGHVKKKQYLCTRF